MPMIVAQYRSNHKSERNRPFKDKPLLGRAVNYENLGWKFIPEIPGHKRTRKFAPTMKAAEPKWLKEGFPEVEIRKEI